MAAEGVEVSATVNPGYVVPCFMESVYTSHHEQRRPSCVRTHKPGKGLEDSLISSSEGMGLYTLSLLERSRPIPIGVESSMSSVIGRVGLFVSSNSSVIVNTPVTESAGLSVAKAFFDLLRSPISVEAEDDTMRRSCRSGGKSRSLSRV